MTTAVLKGPTQVGSKTSGINLLAWKGVHGITRKVARALGWKKILRATFNAKSRKHWGNGDCGDVIPRLQSLHNQLGRPLNLLVLGCGKCGFINRLSRGMVGHLIGVDLSDDAIDAARNQFTSPELEFVEMDMCEYPLPPEEKFDAILLQESIYYIDKREVSRLFARIFAHSPNALIGITVAHPGDHVALLEHIEEITHLVEKSNPDLSKPRVMLWVTKK